MLGSDIADSVSELVEDTDRFTWTEPQLIRWINEGELTIAQVRPDATAGDVVLTLTANVVSQTVGNHIRLFEVLANVGQDGTTLGDVIVRYERDSMDRFRKTWRADEAEASIEGYIFDDRTPRLFDVYHRPNAALKVLARVSRYPASIDALADTLTVPDEYRSVLTDWVMWRALSRNAEDAPVFQRAVAFLSSFYQALGQKLNADTVASAKNMAPQK